MLKANKLKRMVELGIPEAEAIRLLEENKDEIQSAIDAWLLLKNTVPQSTSFWSRFGASKEDNLLDRSLLEGISASLRDYQGIEEPLNTGHKGNNFLLTLDDNICDPIKMKNRPVGLVGCKQFTPLTCLIQALFFCTPIRNLLLHASYDIADWGSHVENFNIDAEVSMHSLVKELVKVFAALQYSDRAYKSCIPVTKSFLAYREYFNLGIPSTVEETWGYLTHALSGQIPNLISYTHLQLLKNDPNGNISSQSNLIGVSIDTKMNLHDALTNITLARQSYLYSSANALSSGKILSFFAQEGYVLKPDIHFFVDRYLENNIHITEKVSSKKDSILVKIQSLQEILTQITKEKLPIINDTIDFLLNEMNPTPRLTEILQRLETVKGRLRHTEEDLKSNIAKLVAESDDLFLIPELKKYPFRLFAIFRKHTDSETNASVVYINTQTGWWRFEGKMVIPSSFEAAVNSDELTTCIWYTNELSIDERPSDLLPEPLAALIKKDNAQLLEEVKLLTLL